MDDEMCLKCEVLRDTNTLSHTVGFIIIVSKAQDDLLTHGVQSPLCSMARIAPTPSPT